MLLPLDKLDGTVLAGVELSVELETEGNRPFPFTVTARDGEHTWRVLDGRTNPGTSWRHPWLEARFAPRPDDGEGDDAGEQGARAVQRRQSAGGDGRAGLDGPGEEAFFEALGDVLVPAAYAMISCDGHPDDLSALTVDVPPQCTRLGYLLWLAGARWYKVWYYPEGWREGNEKLQGNVPIDDAHAAERTAERLDEVEAFLGTGLAERFPACAERGQALLDQG